MNTFVKGKKGSSGKIMKRDERSKMVIQHAAPKTKGEPEMKKVKNQTEGVLMHGKHWKTSPWTLRRLSYKG